MRGGPTPSSSAWSAAASRSPWRWPFGSALPLDVLVIRKLGVPWSPEVAFGALGPGGVLVRNEVVAARLDAARHRRGAPTGSPRNWPGARRSTGAVAHSWRCVARSPCWSTTASPPAQRRGSPSRWPARLDAARVVLARPGRLVASPTSSCSRRRPADLPAAAGAFGAVSVFYDDFHQVTDAEVAEALTAAACVHPVPSGDADDLSEVSRRNATYERSGVVHRPVRGVPGIFLDRGELEKLFEAEANWNRQQAGARQGQPTQPAGYPPPPAAARRSRSPVTPAGHVPPPPPAHYPPQPAYGHQQQESRLPRPLPAEEAQGASSTSCSAEPRPSLRRGRSHVVGCRATTRAIDRWPARCFCEADRMTAIRRR